mgnify:CR=1 FL=1
MTHDATSDVPARTMMTVSSVLTMRKITVKVASAYLAGTISRIVVSSMLRAHMRVLDVMVRSPLSAMSALSMLGVGLIMGFVSVRRTGTRTPVVMYSTKRAATSNAQPVTVQESTIALTAWTTRTATT